MIGAALTEYPDFILEMADFLPSSSTSTESLEILNSVYIPLEDYYLLWEMILSHFFPISDGYAISQDWMNPNDSSWPTEFVISFVVFHHSVPDSPLVILQLSSPSDFSNGHLRDAAAHLSMTTHFDLLAPYSDYREILVIAAMGKSFKALRRETCLSSAEADSWIGHRFGRDEEWIQDIASEEGYALMRKLVDRIQLQTSAN